MTVKRWRDSPDATPSFTQLRLLFRRVFVKAIRRIGHNGMDRIIGSLFQPIKAVSVDEGGPAMHEWRIHFRKRAKLPLQSIISAEAVNSALFTNKQLGSVQP
jgi:hypothetical protein